MICLVCEGEEFIEKELALQQEFNGKIVWVNSLVNVCTNCGYKQLTDKQANMLCEKVNTENTEHYREIEFLKKNIETLTNTNKMLNKRLLKYHKVIMFLLGEYK
jgi:predicted nucleic-acid-binding Zn-ribbon protein